ncbi:MAG: hypothetical protein LBU70_06245, partial [Chitinispirillales bacterium]|nr:hypothetical protein [Chitinispirillales bacterium]
GVTGAEPLSPKKNLILKILILKTLKASILTLRSIAAGLIDRHASLAMTGFWHIFTRHQPNGQSGLK